MVTLDLCPAQSWDRHLWCVYSSTAASLSHHRHWLQGVLDSPGEDSNACSVERSVRGAKFPSPTEWSCCSQHGWAFSGFYFCKFAERISTYGSQGTIVVLCKPDRPPEHISVILFLITGLSFSTQPLTPALHQQQQTGATQNPWVVLCHIQACPLDTETLNSQFSGMLPQFPL